MIEQMPNNTDQDFGEDDTTFTWDLRQNLIILQFITSKTLKGFYLNVINITKSLTTAY